MSNDKAHTALKTWERENKIKLSPANRTSYLWERIQGIPPNAPHDIPTGWFKPPITHDILLSVNHPGKIFTLEFQNETLETEKDLAKLERRMKIVETKMLQRYANHEVN